jgi:Transposase IS116/IS110/IS902 family
MGLVPRRYRSGEVDYVGGLSKCGDRRVWTLLYEAANVMLTRYKGQLKLKDWAFAIAERSTMRKARAALAPVSRSSCTRCRGTKRSSCRFRPSNPQRQEAECSSQEERGPREGADGGADCVARGQPPADCDFNLAASVPAYPIKAPASAQRTQASQGVDNRKSLAP